MTNPGGAVGTNGAYGGRTSVNAFNDVLSAFNGRGILNGWNAVPGGGMVVNLGGSAMVRDVAIVENDLGQLTTINNISTQPIPVLLDAAPTLGSRIDVIVGYVNNPPDAVQTNPVQIDNPSVCGLIAVQSGVSTNPSVPTEDMIRAAITADGGAGTTAYYVILATVEVATGVTTITPNAITQGPMVNIGSAAIADGSVTTQKLADGAVSNAKLATEAVKSNNIDWGTMAQDGAGGVEVFSIRNDVPRRNGFGSGLHTANTATDTIVIDGTKHTFDLTTIVSFWRSSSGSDQYGSIVFGEIGVVTFSEMASLIGKMVLRRRHGTHSTPNYGEAWVTIN